MLRAIGRWFTAVGYFFTGRVDSARRNLDTNPHVVRAKYDDIARERLARIHQYKQAVAALIAQQEGKVEKVKALTEDVKRLEDLKAGALAKARKLVEEAREKGLSKEAIQGEEDYKTCLNAYRDFSRSLEEKQSRIDDIEGDVKEYGERIAEHKAQLQVLLREVEDLRAEAADAVADVVMVKEEKEIAETLAGIAQDGSAQELQRLREVRRELKAEVRITKELADVTNTKAQEEEFLRYARQSESTNEFDALIGLAEAADGEGKESTRDSALPE